jgi:ATP-binding cassette subfamily B protein
VRQQQRKAESLVILNGPLFNLVMYACMIAISYYGGQYIIGGTMTTGEFMSFLTYLRNILFSLMMLSSSLMQIVFAQASVDRANEVLNEQPDITDENADPALTPADGSIEFRDVCFKYSAQAEKNALDHIDLKIASGQTVGILGSTGSGKTTLVQLLPRLYDATSGTVLVGGHDVRDYKIPVLRKEVSMVLQKNQLFSGTIEENLKWGNPQATHQQVVAAAKVAQADDFITSFPKGYDTELGQGGGNVSGGQKQRLCIARALLKEPKIIILDDSTSAVDTDTDKRIRKALKEDLQGMTTLIIAQRIASVMDADQIVVMDDGRIADLGTHEELLKRNAVYRDLFETQMKGVAE